MQYVIEASFLNSIIGYSDLDTIMESESMRSEPGSRSRRGRGIHNPALNNNTGVPTLHHRTGDRSRHSHRSGSSHAKNKKPDMAPFQTTVNLDENGRDGQEIIEVQILPRMLLNIYNTHL